MICLSFDSDHMSESRMSEFLSTHEIAGTATFFCTQPYECLRDAGHELAPHPLLVAGTDWENELARKRREFPAARGWRSHSCVFSHLIAEWLGKNGYDYVSTHDQFGVAGLEPTRHSWGIWHLPIYYMDTLDISAAPALHVFDFHPIHIMLNSPDPDFYFATRDRFRAGEPAETLRHKGYGVANYFADLRAALLAAGSASIAMGDALGAFLRRIPIAARAP
jgi:hypothetical protein